MSSFPNEYPRRGIVALQGASRAAIQKILADFALRLGANGVRLGGVVEVATGDRGGDCRSLALHDLYTGALIPISQDLGPGSTACNLDLGGLAAACAAVERAVSAGVDLVILNKFGKAEAERGGLGDAFRAAIAADLPIVTAVSPLLSHEWSAFAGDLSNFIPADAAALDKWWSNHAAHAFALAAE